MLPEVIELFSRRNKVGAVQMYRFENVNIFYVLPIK